MQGVARLGDGTGLPSSRRDFAAHSLIRPEEPDLRQGYLIETGLVTAAIHINRTPATCVALIGPGTLLVAEPSPATYQAVSPVTATELPVPLLQRVMQQQPRLAELYHAQLRDRLAQAECVAACNARHPLAQRCARWLSRLYMHLGPEIAVTHEFMAGLLGVRRAGVSVTLETLQRAGILRQQRGCIIVLDPARLERHTCPCRNTMTTDDISITLAMILTAAHSVEQPRVWIEREIQDLVQQSEKGDQAWVRREAVLRACPAIMARGRSALSASPLAMASQFPLPTTSA